MKRGKGICAAILISLCGATAATVVSASADTTGDQAAPAPDVTVAADTTASAPDATIVTNAASAAQASDPGGTRGGGGGGGRRQARAAPTTVPRWAPLLPAAATARRAGGDSSPAAPAVPAPRARAAAAATRRAAPTAARARPHRRPARPATAATGARAAAVRPAGVPAARRASPPAPRRGRGSGANGGGSGSSGNGGGNTVGGTSGRCNANCHVGEQPQAGTPTFTPAPTQTTAHDVDSHPDHADPGDGAPPGHDPDDRPRLADLDVLDLGHADPDRPACRDAWARRRRGRHGQPGSARRAPRHGLAAPHRDAEFDLNSARERAHRTRVDALRLRLDPWRRAAPPS